MIQLTWIPEARPANVVSDPCPKLGGLGSSHVVREDRRPARDVRGRRKAPCIYCNRSIDLGPAS